ncbi:hypothetical protein EXN66_Car006551 [Channa argus]|uniref:Uncharacterized protein n=1 Tax=Channa argus TaxID=215402 RepID=A0A6G1PKX1_CHAAH|nr:hypothetical protein EXN66_Car006551 [Channa argus]
MPSVVYVTTKPLEATPPKSETLQLLPGDEAVSKPDRIPVSLVALQFVVNFQNRC